MKFVTFTAVLLCAIFLHTTSTVAQDHPAINQPDKFAWQVFAEINKPVNADEPDGSAVWERWALARDAFANPNVAPVWPQEDRQRSIDRLEARPLQQVILELQIAGVANPIAAAQAGDSRRVDPAVIQRHGNETRMNRETFDFIASNDLYYIEGQEKFFNQGLKVDFPVAAREIKAQWRRLDDASQHGRYHTAQVNNRGTTETWGLTALHITTKDLPNWFWATFEHKDNEGFGGVLP